MTLKTLFHSSSTLRTLGSRSHQLDGVDRIADLVQLSFIAPRFLALPWVPRVRSDGGVIAGAETLIPK